MIPEAKVGQIWQDADPRSYGRCIRVLIVEREHVICRGCSRAGLLDGGPKTRILIRRLKPTSTGYRLVGMAKFLLDAE